MEPDLKRKTTRNEADMTLASSQNLDSPEVKEIANVPSTSCHLPIATDADITSESVVGQTIGCGQMEKYYVSIDVKGKTVTARRLSPDRVTESPPFPPINESRKASAVNNSLCGSPDTCIVSKRSRVQTNCDMTTRSSSNVGIKDLRISIPNLRFPSYTCTANYTDFNSEKTSNTGNSSLALAMDDVEPDPAVTRDMGHVSYCHSVPCKEKQAAKVFSEKRKRLLEKAVTTQPCSSEPRESGKGWVRYYKGIKPGLLDHLPRSTRIKTRSDVAVLLSYLRSEPQNETRNLEDIPPEELDAHLVGFFKTIKKVTGEDYGGVTMPTFMGSFNRYLKLLDYPFSLYTSCLFFNTRKAMENRRDKLVKAGCGSRKLRLPTLTPDEIKTLKEMKLLGLHNPVSLLNSLYYSNSVHFNLKNKTNHYRLLWTDFKLKTNSKGREYIFFDRYRGRKLTTKYKVFAQPGDPEMCPLALYKAYRDRRPCDVQTDRFYLAPVVHHYYVGEVWYKTAHMGKNSLANIMNNLMKRGGIHRPSLSGLRQAETPDQDGSTEDSDSTENETDEDDVQFNTTQAHDMTQNQTKDVAEETAPRTSSCSEDKYSVGPKTLCREGTSGNAHRTSGSDDRNGISTRTPCSMDKNGNLQRTHCSEDRDVIATRPSYSKDQDNIATRMPDSEDKDVINRRSPFCNNSDILQKIPHTEDRNDIDQNASCGVNKDGIAPRTPGSDEKGKGGMQGECGDRVGTNQDVPAEFIISNRVTTVDQYQTTNNYLHLDHVPEGKTTNYKICTLNCAPDISCQTKTCESFPVAKKRHTDLWNLLKCGHPSLDGLYGQPKVATKSSGNQSECSATTVPPRSLQVTTSSKRRSNTPIQQFYALTTALNLSTADAFGTTPKVLKVSPQSAQLPCRDLLQGENHKDLNLNLGNPENNLRQDMSLSHTEGVPPCSCNVTVSTLSPVSCSSTEDSKHAVSNVFDPSLRMLNDQLRQRLSHPERITPVSTVSSVTAKVPVCIQANNNTILCPRTGLFLPQGSSPYRDIFHDSEHLPSCSGSEPEQLGKYPAPPKTLPDPDASKLPVIVSVRSLAVDDINLSVTSGPNEDCPVSLTVKEPHCGSTVSESELRLTEMGKSPGESIKPLDSCPANIPVNQDWDVLVTKTPCSDTENGHRADSRKGSVGKMSDAHPVSFKVDEPAAHEMKMSGTPDEGLHVTKRWCSAASGENTSGIEGREVPVPPSPWTLGDRGNIQRSEMETKSLMQSFSCVVYCLPDPTATPPNITNPTEEDWLIVENHMRSGYGFHTEVKKGHLPKEISLLAGQPERKYRQMFVDMFPVLEKMEFSVYCREEEGGPLTQTELQNLQVIPDILYIVPYAIGERKPLPILVPWQPSSQVNPWSKLYINTSEESSCVLSPVKTTATTTPTLRHLLDRTTYRSPYPAVSMKHAHMSSREHCLRGTSSLDVKFDAQVPHTYCQYAQRDTVLSTEKSVPNCLYYSWCPATTSSKVNHTPGLLQTGPKDTFVRANNHYRDFGDFAMPSRSKNDHFCWSKAPGRVTVSHPVLESRLHLQTRERILQDCLNSNQTTTNETKHSDGMDCQSSSSAHQSLGVIPEPVLLADAKLSFATHRKMLDMRTLMVRSDQFLKDVYNYYRRCEGALHFPLEVKVKIPGNPECVNMEPVMLFTRFWQLAFSKWFDGNQEFVPKLSAGFDGDCFKILGAILAHGLMHCSYWPLKLSRACAVAVLTGSECSDVILQFAYMRCIPENQTEVVEALSRYPEQRIIGKLWTRCDKLLKSYGARWDTESVLQNICRTHLIHRPYWALIQMSDGLNMAMVGHRYDVQEGDVMNMYDYLTPSALTILARIKLCVSKTTENDVKGSMMSCIGAVLMRMNTQQLEKLLRLWTGSDCQSFKEIYVELSWSEVTITLSFLVKFRRMVLHYSYMTTEALYKVLTETLNITDSLQH